MKKRDMRMARLRMVLREYQTARIAISILDEHLKADPSMLAGHKLAPGDFRRFRSNLEGTYFIRLFSEFESAIRDIWNSLLRPTNPRVSDLLNSLASRRQVMPRVLEQVHAARAYRNSLVHEESSKIERVPITESIHSLLRFFSHMPPDW